MNAYPDFDTEIQSDIDEYNTSMDELLDEVIGFSQVYHERVQVGCFYTDALRERLEVDVTFQNYGGIRSPLNQGDITVREIYEIEPFNNGTVIFTMMVLEIKEFLMNCQSWLCYSGVEIEQIDSDIQIRDYAGNIISDDVILTVGINDYISAVYDNYFPETGNVQPYTTAEALMFYLRNINSDVNYPDCGRYFRYE